MFDAIIICTVSAVCLYALYRFRKDFSWKDFLYHKERPAMMRLEDLRKQYDGVDDLETTVRLVEKHQNVEVYVSCEYQHVAGGKIETVKIPMKANSRMWTMLCQEEKKRLHRAMAKARLNVNIPYRG